MGLSAYLRLSGITWGINTGYGHYLNFHPDEFVSIGGVSPIVPFAGKFKAPGAYFEGTFNYYLWAVPEMLHQLSTGVPPIPEPDVPPGQIKFLLLSSRIMSVTFDLVSLLLVFAIISGITGQYVAGLFGALLYGILPMQVIYSHFMRTYALSNLLCVLVIWLSVKAVKQRYWVLFVVTGVVAGLAGATRYSAGVVISVPCLFVLCRGLAGPDPWLRGLAKSTMYLLSGPLWLLLGGFVLGLLLGEPMLLLDFKNVVREIAFEVSHYAPTGRRNPFDLAPVWRYLSVLIPYAAYPLLWLLLYVSTLYVILRPSLWPTVVPLSLFAACYTYMMAKGYVDVFARLVMFILPVFCIFAGLAVGDLVPKLRKRPVLSGIVTALTLLLIIPTIVFDCAYGLAMRRKDAREMLIDDMRDFTKNRSSTTIGVSEGGGYFYTAMPAVFPLKSNKVAVQIESSLTAPADFFVMGFERPLDNDFRNSTISQVESGGVYRFINAYSRVPTVFGKRLDLSSFPPDMTYPFPTILLFRKLTQP
jgi:hypothetical protein